MKRTELKRSTGLKPGRPPERRTPMARGTSELKPGRPLERRAPLVAKSAPKAARPKPAVPRDVRAELVKRSGGKCEIRLPGFCQGAGMETSHRKNRKSGGRHGAARVECDRLSALMDACSMCHHLVTVKDRRIPDVYDMGWQVKEGLVPSQVEVWYRGRMVWLNDAGRVVEYKEAAA